MLIYIYEDGDHMIEILKALADETRLRILAQIFKGEMCVCEIEQSLALTQSNASRHLTILRKAGILEGYKNAQWVYYRVNEEFIKDNAYLYEYLKGKLNSIPCYDKDCENYNKCRQMNLCNCQNKLRGDINE